MNTSQTAQPTSSDFKPTLALDIELEDVKFPCYVQEKHNGVRFEKINGRALSRTLKPIPNRFIRHCIEAAHFDNVEGEILIYGAQGVNDVVSAVMSEDGQPDFHLMLFDITNSNSSYCVRYATLATRVSVTSRQAIVASSVPHTLDDLKIIVQDVANRNGEGIIIRYANLGYKHGRSTKGHPGLLRYVLHQTATATILSAEEQMHNENEQYTDELGRTKRSTHQDGKVAAGVLGAFLVSCPLFPKPFRVGTGYSATQREIFWLRRDILIGKVIEFEYKPTTVIEVPAPAVFKRFVGAI